MPAPTHSTTIHPTAIIDESAQIGGGCHIGPFCVIGPHCTIGEGTRLHNNVTLMQHTTLGRENEVYPYAVLGGNPQDAKYGGEESWLEIGDHNIIRESVTLHRASGKGQKTRIGSHNMLMAYMHAGHNVEIGSHNIIANNVQIAGHVIIGSRIVIGGTVAIHQNVKVGDYAMVGGFSGLRQDVPPFALVALHESAAMAGMNVVGMRRAGISAEDRAELKRAFKLLFHTPTTRIEERLAEVKEKCNLSLPGVQTLIAFMEQDVKRGLYTIEQ